MKKWDKAGKKKEKKKNVTKKRDVLELVVQVSWLLTKRGQCCCFASEAAAVDEK